MQDFNGKRGMYSIWSMYPLICLGKNRTITMEIVNYIGTAVMSVLTWIVGKKWVIPLVVKWYRDWRFNQLKYKSDLQGVEQQGNDIYQSQIKFLNDEINTLQNMVKMKSHELKDVYTELSRLRTRLKDLELTCINAKEDLQLFTDNCCMKENCPLRVPCATANKIMEKYVEDYDEGKSVVTEEKEEDNG